MANLIICRPKMALRRCTVGFRDARGIRHEVDVEAESLFEAVVLAVRRFRDDPWTEAMGPSTVLEVEPREPTAKHSISLQQVERWLGSASPSPHEATKKAKLRVILVEG